MHGSSSIPTEIREEIVKYGGHMEEAVGVPLEAIQRAINNGIRKVNVDSDSRMAMTAAIRMILVVYEGGGWRRLDGRVPSHLQGRFALRGRQCYDAKGWLELTVWSNKAANQCFDENVPLVLV